MPTKKLYRYFNPGTATHVILHASYREKKGKPPAATSKTSRLLNPREALKEAVEFYQSANQLFDEPDYPCPPDIEEKISNELIRFCNLKIYKPNKDRLPTKVAVKYNIMRRPHNA